MHYPKAIRYMINLLWILTLALNALLLGDPRESVSSRAGKARKRGSTLGTWTANLIDTLFFFHPNHCEREIDPSVGQHEIWHW